MYVVYSSELDALDQSDGDEDHIVMLHNSLGGHRRRWDTQPA